ncbi:histidine phosphatase family protein [Candidatus Gottesmanbacteria bacterium]|nr:histidine phosphatase family protein [Candidatus Gottesmanbacteria bacterium]
MKKTVIYFLRHGEVENPKKIIYGRLPGFNLSENGIKRIKEVAQELKSQKIDYLYASPMRRTRQTAEILSQVFRIKKRISRYLIESKLIHAGLPLDIFKKEIQPKLYEEKYLKLGQESPESQADRMWRFVQVMKSKHIGKTILAVSHGDPIVILKAKILGKPFNWQFKLENYLKPGYYLILSCEGNTYRIK